MQPAQPDPKVLKAKPDHKAHKVKQVLQEPRVPPALKVHKVLQAPMHLLLLELLPNVQAPQQLEPSGTTPQRIVLRDITAARG